MTEPKKPKQPAKRAKVPAHAAANEPKGTEVTIRVPDSVVAAGRIVRQGALWFDALARRVIERVRERGGKPPDEPG